jgi:hypothetical protein
MVSTLEVDIEVLSIRLFPEATKIVVIHTQRDHMTKALLFVTN